MIILAIETSCDETSAAVLKDGREVLSNVISSQIEFHKKYGGIVPELASRKHIEVINPIIQEALDKANVKFKDLGAVAVTHGPGLVGSLLVGICAAKAISYSLNIPLVGVNHLEAHIYANYLDQNPKLPFICLLVSGGHTMLVMVKDHGKYKVLGRTRDDAAGEAFDKVARFLKLGYPGGPIIDKLAKEGNPNAIKFTRPMIEDGYDFSFSGIKTAVVNYYGKLSVVGSKLLVDIAASFQQTVVEVLTTKTIRAAKDNKCETIALAGGVSANSGLRKALMEKGQEQGLVVHIPPLNLCTDNAAMVGCLAHYLLKQGKVSDLKLPAVASLRL
ncbi:tRNA (adenosine(37)-N6)-threonylcarbamoyltransferase complex transferase subunit TsaD [candidate division WOR-1 bacterium RIFCSPLOWO2_02_FULL_46_20]|uniref:tRNA N6-adenosine threonylcarbamoyltransferase n=2 Tax=Saganbacteria TaxID=1703751 RepID=A0A1F4RAA8_UNCSA|nr:MAG: tRNA (adenosine(37)-N6)-threonylcarbamoyltransferase complex transferase subunit TsaD [candidate division WOR-1 bacterium RIFCSPHIGHO2_02_FULL_45_12]OGC04463.1 MAG: tRNA (adenosine(37)-N6)-threonylcarbamoyltransferase complex transferase subunit TsaD [candidate division WOR-1 bacterium RIFCSPLOWO2_02_FULL_46_20]OGC09615.1 MAG: tRNA (adenosine(37)-N6)-threonylcarbamoyltransferase complex transferase subunit TsaD [candidate division WOR-1 bacterium RIFCSPLOWO2_12_FULL_45_9]